jgi:hypothetical protein|tara:strand:- start:1396 stop:2364 length:969 start_codon:yes stop_codon:yes gene_type:complete
MSTYKALIGKYVRSVSSDPTAAYADGEIWYNTSSNTFKIGLQVGAWASGGTVNTARRYTNGGGTQTAGLMVNGYSTGFSADTEEYNGSSWTSVTNAPFAVYNSSGGGTQTSFFMTGGDLGPSVNTVTAEYDGSNWTTTNNNPNARNGGGGCGTQTAGLYAGGQGNTGTQTYNGSSWTSTGHSLNEARKEVSQAMTGITTAAVIVGDQPSSAVVEEYNGSSWTSQTAVPTAGYARSSSGIQTSALYYGGGSSGFGGTTAALYDGSAWTNVADLATPRGGGASGKNASTSSLAFMAGGQTPGPSNSNKTEEWTNAAGIKTVTTS